MEFLRAEGYDQLEDEEEVLGCGNSFNDVSREQLLCYAIVNGASTEFARVECDCGAFCSCSPVISTDSKNNLVCWSERAHRVGIVVESFAT